MTATPTVPLNYYSYCLPCKVCDVQCDQIGPLFKAFGNNLLAQIFLILRQPFVEASKSIIFGQLF